jgi:hypothetical protein
MICLFILLLLIFINSIKFCQIPTIHQSINQSFSQSKTISISIFHPPITPSATWNTSQSASCCSRSVLAVSCFSCLFTTCNHFRPKILLNGSRQNCSLISQNFCLPSPLPLSHFSTCSLSCIACSIFTHPFAPLNLESTLMSFEASQISMTAISWNFIMKILKMFISHFLILMFFGSSTKLSSCRKALLTVLSFYRRAQSIGWLLMRAKGEFIVFGYYLGLKIGFIVTFGPKNL